MRINLLLLILLTSFTSFGQGTPNITLKYNWVDTTLSGSSAYNNTYNEIWGVERNGRYYGIIGTTNGTHFFDVTDPDAVTEVDYIPGKIQGPIIVHRDFHDYKNYLYVVSDEGSSSLQIMDLQYLPDSVVLVYDTNDLFQRSHNIFIDTATGKLYACGVSKTTGSMPFSSAMRIYDIETDPLNPTLLYEYTDVPYVHDVFVRNDTAYSNAGTSGLYVADFSNVPTSHTPLGSLASYTTWGQGYNHSGWLNDAGTHYYFADETWGLKMKACDVTDLTDIQVKDTFGSAIDPSSIVHNLIARDDMLFVSHYHDGLYIYDISDPAKPVEWGHYDTYSPLDHVSYRGAWGVYPFYPRTNTVLISDMQYGFFVFEASLISSVNEIESENQLEVFPNPSSGNILINTPSISGTGSLKVFDMLGRELITKDVQLDGSIQKFETGLESGHYILLIEHAEGYWRSTIQVNK